jgi:molybdenum cofactor biosynthesis protein B
VVITTGGTGITGRDVTPEAFERVMEKRIEGFGELAQHRKIGTSTMQSLAVGAWPAAPTCSTFPAASAP